MKDKGIALLDSCDLALPGERVPDLATARNRGFTLVLGMLEGRLSLCSSHGREKPLAVDFTQGDLGYRLKRARHEKVVKAAGGICTQQGEKTLVDGTAGLGRDAALLAQAGYRVCMVERNPWLHAMLADGLQRLTESGHPLAASLHLVAGDMREGLHEIQDPDVIYLDPMFPARRKSAAVRKNLQWLQHLEPPAAEDLPGMLAEAMAHATARVVVKRPILAPPLAEHRPSFSLAGKRVRFDVYLRLASG